MAQNDDKNANNEDKYKQIYTLDPNTFIAIHNSFGNSGILTVMTKDHKHKLEFHFHNGGFYVC